MSDKISNNTPEEVDLGVLFNAIGKLFDRIINFFRTIIKGLFSSIISGLKALVKYYRLIFGIIFLAAILGYFMEKIKPEVYESKMLVKPYFESKYQLVTNINYYNALISEQDYEQLTNIFGLDGEAVKQIIDFEIVPGPETENDKIVQYDRFIKSIDSVRAQDISFDDFIENRSIYSGEFFEISVRAFKKDVFKSLESGLNTTFTNTYSIKRMEKRDSLISIQKERILKSIKGADSLQKVYMSVIEEESKSNKGTINLKDGMSIVQEKTQTKEFELLNTKMKLRQELSKLEAQKVEENVFFDTLSSFQRVGAKYSTFWGNYKIIFPVLAFFLICFIYLAKETIKYVNSYEV